MMNGALKHLASCSYLSVVFQTSKGEENVGGRTQKGSNKPDNKRRKKEEPKEGVRRRVLFLFLFFGGSRRKTCEN